MIIHWKWVYVSDRGKGPRITRRQCAISMSNHTTHLLIIIETGARFGPTLYVYIRNVQLQRSFRLSWQSMVCLRFDLWKIIIAFDAYKQCMRWKKGEAGYCICGKGLCVAHIFVLSSQSFGTQGSSIVAHRFMIFGTGRWMFFARPRQIPLNLIWFSGCGSVFKKARILTTIWKTGSHVFVEVVEVKCATIEYLFWWMSNIEANRVDVKI